MAGSYPDVPSRRMAYDDDGTFVGFNINNLTGPVNDVAAANAENLNNEQAAFDAVGGDTFAENRIVLIFPELREVDGGFMSLNGAGHRNFETSVDSTTGINGIWVEQISQWTTYTTVSPTYRTGITNLAVSNVRAVRTRWFDSYHCWAFHLYGEITPGQTPDRLLYIDTLTSLEFSLPIDYGDIPRGSAEDRGFKLRNNSSTLTAATVQITAEATHLDAGNWFTFSEGSGFQSTLPLASSIGPGADSPALTARRIIPDSQGLGLYAARIQTSVGSWS